MNAVKKTNYHKTKIACYMGFITQAIAANFTPLLFLKFVSLFLYIQIRNREAPFLICFSVHKTGLNRSSTIFDIVYYVLPSVLSFWILLFYFTVRTAASDTTILPFVPVTTQRYF